MVVKPVRTGIISYDFITFHHTIQTIHGILAWICWCSSKNWMFQINQSTTGKIIHLYWFFGFFFPQDWPPAAGESHPAMVTKQWLLDWFQGDESLLLQDSEIINTRMFPKIVGFPPKSSILIGFSIINHPFWGTPIFENTHKYQYEPRKIWMFALSHIICFSCKCMAHIKSPLNCMAHIKSSL